MQTKRGTLQWYLVPVIVGLVLLVLLLYAQLGPAGPVSLAMPLPVVDTPDPAVEAGIQARLPVTFTGKVLYDPAAATVRAQSGISVTLYGNRALGSIELAHAVSARDGSFQLTAFSEALRPVSPDQPRVE
jgi:hypothetical protein